MQSLIEIHSRERMFSRAEAQALLPVIHRFTTEVSGEVKKLCNSLEALPNKRSDRARELEGEVDALIERWQRKVKRLGAVPKGLWLADFDNGEGFWCWKYPETRIQYSHGYQDGFSGRKLIEQAQENHENCRCTDQSHPG